MIDDLDEDVKREVRKALADDLSSLDTSTERKLQAARYAALDEYSREKRIPGSGFVPALIPGLIFASSLCVAIGVWLVQPDSEFTKQMRDDHVLFDDIGAQGISSNELEMVEELEFYEWLDANGYTG